MLPCVQQRVDAGQGGRFGYSGTTEDWVMSFDGTVFQDVQTKLAMI